MKDRTNCSHNVNEYPISRNDTVEGASGKPVVFHHTEEGVYRNRQDEDTASQIPRGHKPSLGETCRGMDDYCIVP
jgi:hypothetical protein